MAKQSHICYCLYFVCYRDIIYMNWATTEPTRTYKENCLGLWRDGGWKWGDYPCSYKIGYICEKSTSH